MFDMGFAELLIIAVVGLLVIGPERLPDAIRTGSAWLNRFRRGFNDIKQEVRQELHNDAVMRELRESGEKLRRETESLQRDFTAMTSDDKSHDQSHDKSHDNTRDKDPVGIGNGKGGSDGASDADRSAAQRETATPFMRSDADSTTAAQHGEKDTPGTTDTTQARSSDTSRQATGRES